MIHKEKQLDIKSVSLRPIMLAFTIALATGSVVFTYNLLRNGSTAQNPAPAPPKSSAPAITAVTGLGRLEPQGEVIQLSAPASVEGTRVARLPVKEGDKVRAGQVVAILDNYESRLAALNQAKQQVKVAQTRLAKVKAGAQEGAIAAQQATIARLESQMHGDIAAQQATIARLRAQLRNAEVEYQRNRELHALGAISASALDSKLLPVETFQAQVNEAKANLKRTEETIQQQIREGKATLNRITEVRPVDVQEAQAEIDNAKAAVQKAQADLDLTYVRSPIDSQILKIHTRPGEIVSNKGIAELGQTDQMYAVAEIYDTDIGKVHLGQRATITSEALSGKLEGTVAHIGWQVNKQGIFSTNPLADTDQKVVEVKIRINQPADNWRIARLTNLQVQVAIHL